jgi:hypothetical protein
MPAIVARIGLTRHFLLCVCVDNHVLCEIVNVFDLAILLVYENTNKQLNYSCWRLIVIPILKRQGACLL